MDKPIKIETVRGVEGNSIYIDDFRVAGSKPWGGGSLIQHWDTTVEEILTALAISHEEDKVVYEVVSYNGKYRITFERTKI